jgi:triosephosphate isomerase
LKNQSRKSFVAGNWKMNGSLSLVNDFTQLMDGVDSNSVDVAICPPACLLGVFRTTSFGLGAQDISHLDEGAHTGDLAAAMLKEVGCQYVIVGHSERREDHYESNELVAKKALKALEGGLTPVICIGESLEVRESGQLEAFLGEQISALTAVMSADDLTNSIIAYEPIWAIGTGKTASPQQAQDVHQYIRQHLASYDASMAEKIRILYGGSVKSSNAKELFAQVDIDGGLIGGASLKVDEFRKICQAAN